jgi:hypothetical protein
MQVRLVFNLVNQSSIVSDWEKATYNEAAKSLENTLSHFSNLIYFEMKTCGRKRYVLAQHVTDIFIEEQDETKF